MLDDRDDYDLGASEWARLHGYEYTPQPTPTEHCPRHGTYTPTSILDADCPQCDLEDVIAREARRAADLPIADRRSSFDP